MKPDSLIILWLFVQGQLNPMQKYQGQYRQNRYMWPLKMWCSFIQHFTKAEAPSRIVKITIISLVLESIYSNDETPFDVSHDPMWQRSVELFQIHKYLLEIWWSSAWSIQKIVEQCQFRNCSLCSVAAMATIYGFPVKIPSLLVNWERVQIFESKLLLCILQKLITPVLFNSRLLGTPWLAVPMHNIIVSILGGKMLWECASQNYLFVWMLGDFHLEEFSYFCEGFGKWFLCTFFKMKTHVEQNNITFLNKRVEVVQAPKTRMWRIAPWVVDSTKSDKLKCEIFFRHVNLHQAKKGDI